MRSNNEIETGKPVEVRVKSDSVSPEEDIRQRTEVVVDTVEKVQRIYLETRKTIKEQLEEIRDLGINRYGMEPTHLRHLIDEVFKERHVNSSYVRKLLPDMLKDSSRIPLSHKQRQELKQQQEQQVLLLQREKIMTEANVQRTTLNEEIATISQESGERTEKEALRRACEEIERLHDEVQKLRQPFNARALLTIRGIPTPMVIRIDPINKKIISIK